MDTSPPALNALPGEARPPDRAWAEDATGTAGPTRAQQQALAALHERPAVPISPPAELTLLAYASPAEDRAAEIRHVNTIIPGRAVAGTGDQVVGHVGKDLLIFEPHTSFSTYVIAGEPPQAGAPFATRPLGDVPADWVAKIPGELAVAVRIAVTAEAAAGTTGADLVRSALACGIGDHVGSSLLGGTATVWTDFRADSDGYVRMLVVTRDLQPGQIGRLVQTLFEIESYRSFALLVLPLARSMNDEIDRLEAELGEITADLQAYCQESDRQEALDRIIALATAGEALAGRMATPFAGALAFAAIVAERLQGLSEARIEANLLLSEFISRRFGPAMRTIETARHRLTAFEEIVARTADLLRTAVEVSVERQNRDLLASVDRRARSQLRLQEMVEGLSVAAISYYGLGVGSYVLKGFEAAGMDIEVPKIVTALIVPVFVIGVWLALLALRRRHRRSE